MGPAGTVSSHISTKAVQTCSPPTTSAAATATPATVTEGRRVGSFVLIDTRNAQHVAHFLSSGPVSATAASVSKTGGVTSTITGAFGVNTSGSTGSAITEGHTFVYVSFTVGSFAPSRATMPPTSSVTGPSGVEAVTLRGHVNARSAPEAASARAGAHKTPASVAVVGKSTARSMSTSSVTTSPALANRGSSFVVACAMSSTSGFW